MDITVTKTVVVTVSTISHVINRLDIVTRGVTRGILMITAAKVNLLMNVFCEFSL